jgi:hypothetical protein
MSQKDEHYRYRVTWSSGEPRRGDGQDKEEDMDPASAHGKGLFLLMTIPVQLFLVFVFPHLLPSFLDHTSHSLVSFSKDGMISIFQQGLCPLRAIEMYLEVLSCAMRYALCAMPFFD